MSCRRQSALAALASGPASSAASAGTSASCTKHSCCSGCCCGTVPAVAAATAAGRACAAAGSTATSSGLQKCRKARSRPSTSRRPASPDDQRLPARVSSGTGQLCLPDWAACCGRTASKHRLHRRPAPSNALRVWPPKRPHCTADEPAPSPGRCCRPSGCTGCSSIRRAPAILRRHCAWQRPRPQRPEIVDVDCRGSAAENCLHGSLAGRQFLRLGLEHPRRQPLPLLAVGPQAPGQGWGSPHPLLDCTAVRRADPGLKPGQLDCCDCVRNPLGLLPSSCCGTS